ncbi:Clavaminate synthase-like protein, partial [Cryphonectria parasitica EP155]
IRLTFASSSPDGHVFRLPALWFRDACPCSVCVSESSGQKRFVTCDVDASPETESCRVLEDGSLEIVWAHDFLQGGQHPSVYDTDFIRRLLQETMLPELYTPARLLWDRATFARDMDARAISYSDWMGGGPSFARAFRDLMRWGLVFVKGVPETEAAVLDIASKVGHLQSTFYGLTWDVVSKPNAENAAYTSEFLCLHQDLMYWTPAPRIQLLHCLKNECEGGESLFSDGLRAAAEIQLKNPEHYHLLRTEPVAYQYSKNGNFYRRTRPVIRTQSSALDAPPKDVSWSPPFQGVFPPDRPEEGYQAMNQKNCQTLPAWRSAARSFRDSLEADKNMLQYRLQPGDCVVFDNRRILHGRTRFDTASGHRRLRGTYLDTQTLTSALTRLVK